MQTQEHQSCSMSNVLGGMVNLKKIASIVAPGADLEGAPAARAPSIFCRDTAPDFV